MTKTKRRTKHWSGRLVEYNPCQRAFEWARRQPSYAVAWEKCQYPAWLAFCLNGFSYMSSESGLYEELVVGPEGPSPIAAGEKQRSKKRCDWIRASHKRPALRKKGKV
jgi:hypothetical protein